MKACRKQHKATMEPLRKEWKANREERKAKRAARKAAKGE